MSRPDGGRLPRRSLGTPLAAGLSAILLLLAGCTTDPAPAVAPKAVLKPILRANQRALVEGRTPAPQPAVLSFCYSNLVNTPEQLEYASTEACKRLGGRLVFYGEDSVLTQCPLLQPVRATYLCYPEAGRTIEQPRQRLPSIQDPTEQQQDQEELLLR